MEEGGVPYGKVGCLIVRVGGGWGCLMVRVGGGGALW